MFASSMLVLGGFLVLAADGADDALKAELKNLEGTWLHVTTEREGEKKNEPRTLWVFDGNRAKVHFETIPIMANPRTWTFSAKPTNLLLTYVFRFDPTKTPKTLDQQTEFRDNKTLTNPILGIYKLDGDTLTICYAGYYDKGKRPAEFAAAKGSDRRMYVLKREK